MPRIRLQTLALLTLLAAGGAVVYLDRSPSAGGAPAPLPEGPGLEMGAWQGRDIPYDPDLFRRTVAADRTVFRRYVRPADRARVDLYLGYYHDMERSDRSHSPLVCYEGQGWRVLESRIRTVRPGGAAGSFRATEMIIGKGDRRRLVLFWYQAGDRIFARKSGQRFYLVRSKLWGRGQANLWVRISTPVDRAGREAAQRVLEDFATDLVPRTVQMLRG